MKFGVNLLLFDDQVTPALLNKFQHFSDLGFDGIEVPLFDPASVDTDRIRKKAEACNLEITVSGALPPGTNFYTSSSKRKRASQYIRDLLSAGSALGAKIIAGPLFKPVGDFDESFPLDAQWRETIREMKPLIEIAESKKMVLAFEPLNRFETNFMNTVSQGIDFCKKLGSPYAELLLDTFHMHIEEKDSAAAIKKASQAGVFAHFHASENDRGVAGSGQVRWNRIREAVHKCSYDRWVVLESFNQANQSIKTAISCWRPFYPSTEKFMKSGLGFVKKLFSE